MFFVFVLFTLPCRQQCWPRMAPKKIRAVEAEAEEPVRAEMEGDDGESDAELGSVSEDVSLAELRDMFRSHLALQQALAPHGARGWPAGSHICND